MKQKNRRSGEREKEDNLSGWTMVFCAPPEVYSVVGGALVMAVDARVLMDTQWRKKKCGFSRLRLTRGGGYI